MILRNPTASPRNVPSSSNDFYVRYEALSAFCPQIAMLVWLKYIYIYIYIPSYFFNLTSWQQSSSFYFLNIAACWKVRNRRLTMLASCITHGSLTFLAPPPPLEFLICIVDERQ